MLDETSAPVGQASVRQKTACFSGDRAGSGGFRLHGTLAGPVGARPGASTGRSVAGTYGEHPDLRRRHRQPGVGEDADASRSPAADLREALRGPEVAVVYGRGVPHGGDDGPGTAAVGGRPVVRSGVMPHGHPRVRQRAAGGFPARPGGKDHRQVLPHAVHPRPSHASDAAADPPVGVAGASVFPPGPAHVPGAVVESGGRSHRTAVHVVERLPPAVPGARTITVPATPRLPEVDPAGARPAPRWPRPLYPFPTWVQAATGRTEYRARPSSATLSAAIGGTCGAGPWTRTPGRIGKRWSRTTRPMFAARASAARPVHRSRAAGDHVAEPKPTAPGTPCRSGRIQWRT